jgi:predicted amidohydrolase
MARAAHDAAVDNVRLLLFPEMFLSGYNIGSSAVHRLAEPHDGVSAQAVKQIAREFEVAILYGYPERAAPDTVFNAVQLIDAGGVFMANYRKTHLFGDLDRSMFSPAAERPPVVTLDGWQLGLLICYDVEFPENARGLALAGADLIAAPTANMAPYEFVATTIIPVRAYENQVYLAYANYCGREGGLDYCGLSCIAAPDGTLCARAGHSDAMIVADLDLERLKAARSTNTYLSDRRPELYEG